MNATTKFIARGILKHHFWGHYVADIVIAFKDVAAVPIALEKLKLKIHEPTYRGATGGLFRTEWKVSMQDSRAIMISAEGDALEEIQLLLCSFGADEKKMNSMATSMDSGEVFQIEIPA